MRSGQYSHASVEYEYIYYSSSDNIAKTKALLGKANCLKKVGLFSDAEKCLERVVFERLPDSVSYESFYQLALCSYLASDFGFAESQFLQMQFFVKDSSLVYSSYPLYVLVLNEQKKWKEAEEKMELYITKTQSSDTKKDSLIALVRKIYQPENIPKLKNLHKAIRLSEYLPGFGQFYLGYWGEGIASVSLQAASLVFIGYNLYVAQYFTAITFGTGTLQKFYLGGVHRTEFLANKRNYELTKKYNDDVRSLILTIL